MKPAARHRPQGSRISVRPSLRVGKTNGFLTASAPGVDEARTAVDDPATTRTVAEAMSGITLLVHQETVPGPPGGRIMAPTFRLLGTRIFGMAPAPPLVVAIRVVVQMVCVRDVLGDEVRLPGP